MNIMGWLSKHMQPRPLEEGTSSISYICIIQVMIG